MSSSVAMMDLSCNTLMESSSDSGEESSGTSVNSETCVSPKINFQPKDLTLKPALKRSKPIPPPLNLRSEEQPEETSLSVATCLKEFAIIATGPQSPLVQKNLPFRKRAHSVPDGAENGPFSAPPVVLKYYPSLFPFKQEASGDEDSNPPLNLSLPPTPKDFQDRDTESPQGASAVVSSSHSEVASPQISSSSHPTSPNSTAPSSVSDSHHLNISQQSFPRHHIPPWSPYLPTHQLMSPHWLNSAPSALLSPAPSSLGSSQEDLRHGALPLSSVASLVYESDPWRLPWPYPVWHCFQIGTLLRFSLDNSEITLRAEDVHQSGELQFLTPERFGPLRVQSINSVESQSGVTEITFSCITPGIASDVKVVATCYSYHTFLVMEKGWCAVSPELVLHRYGIQCQLLECGDTCALPPKMPSVASPGICEKFKRFSFSPDELSSSLPSTPSSLILSPPNTPTMKSQHHHLSTQKPQSSSSVPSKGSKSKKPSTQQSSEKGSKASNKVPLDPDRPKRPMNAFMLFAKQHRLKLIRMHPGKDNRFVSVILGEAWRQLPADQKEVFIAEAKALSHERKRLHPECWKRKRTQTSNSGGSVKMAPSND